jgi:hypothetical protein
MHEIYCPEVPEYDLPGEDDEWEDEDDNVKV